MFESLRFKKKLEKSEIQARLDLVCKIITNLVDSELRGLNYFQVGFVKNIDVRDSGQIEVSTDIPTPLHEIREHVEDRIRSALVREGIRLKDIKISTDKDANLFRPAKRSGGNANSSITNIIAFSSGKGGVGKSSLTGLTAAYLSRAGARVGILDADIYGPSVPRIFGLEGQLRSMEKDGKSWILPIEKDGLKFVSVGSMVPKDSAIVWRGPMLHKLLTQFSSDVDWGDLDYLLIDLPPGTGDVALSLAQLFPITGSVVVTSPQAASVEDVRKEVVMWKQLNVPILGIVENFVDFECDSCGEKTKLFGSGGGQFLAQRFDLEFLMGIPMLPAIQKSLDLGNPYELIKNKTGLAYSLIREFSNKISKISAGLIAENRDPKEFITLESN